MLLTRCLSVALVVVWSCVGEAQNRKAAHLVRVYDGDAAEFMDLSGDGRLLLTRGGRTIKCSDGKRACHSGTLAVCDTNTGKRVAELATDRQGWAYFSTAGFVADHVVGLVQAGPGTNHTWTEWDLIDGTRRQFSLPADDRLSAVCALKDNKVLLVKQPEAKDSRQPTLNLTDRSQRMLELSQPELIGLLAPSFDCKNWKSGSSYLVEGTEGQKEVEQVRLFRISTNPTVAYTLCPFSPGERTHGHAASPDGSLIAVITGAGDLELADGVQGPDYRVFLNVLDGAGCKLLRRVELAFPEKPRERAPLLAPKNRYIAGARLASAFERVAISPDNSKLALAYGVRTGGPYSDAVAFFGIYSLANGRLLATLEADTFRNGVWPALRSGDLVPTRWAPIEGELMFSPDSRTLYAGSKRTWQWDLSGLR